MIATNSLSEIQADHSQLDSMNNIVTQVTKNSPIKAFIGTDVTMTMTMSMVIADKPKNYTSTLKIQTKLNFTLENEVNNNKNFLDCTIIKTNAIYTENLHKSQCYSH